MKSKLNDLLISENKYSLKIRSLFQKKKWALIFFVRVYYELQIANITSSHDRGSL